MIGLQRIAQGNNHMAAIAYVTVGTNDMDRALAFYDALLGSMGGGRLMPTPKGQAYRLSSGALFMVTKPYDDEHATVGNGTMIALGVDSAEEVQAAYDKAIELGATCEGQPGKRGNFGTFCYFRDLDGNKIAICKLGG
jgi:catechol 2,3-dioxygenase-like lactoylglutathione lyase family enzyme